MRYLVTGGAGFIGSHLVQTLLEQGAQVRVLDDFSTGKRENLEAVQDDIEMMEADLRDADKVVEAVRGVEVVFHEAAFVSVPQSMDEPQTCFEVNVTGTSLLFEAARRAGVRRVVFASSAAVYGDASEIPLTEHTRLQPLSPYAASKCVDEIYGRLYTEAFDLEVTALRYFNVYGPRQRPDSMYAAVVPIFIRRLLDGRPITIYGDGGQTRDMINIRDVVRANLAASEDPAAPGQVFNICSGTEMRILDLVQVLQGLFPDAPEPVFAGPRPGDIYRSIGSPHKAAELMGFRAEVTLEQGLRESVEWMRGL